MQEGTSQVTGVEYRDRLVTRVSHSQQCLCNCISDTTQIGNGTRNNKCGYKHTQK